MKHLQSELSQTNSLGIHKVVAARDGRFQEWALDH